MELTQEHLIEEYHLPMGNPKQLKKRLSEIVRAIRRIYGSPANNQHIEIRAKFLESWCDSIVIPVAQLPTPIRPKHKKFV
jgi:hypothetical protein